jgi:cytochrome b561
VDFFLLAPMPNDDAGKIGVLMADMSGFTTHACLAPILAGVVVLHRLAALYHQFVPKD